MTVKLSMGALPELSGIGTPRYDRAALSPGIVHFGVGNFHRAHQAVYLHELLQDGLDQDWAIIGAGTLPSDAAMRERLQAQDFLSTIVEQTPDANRAYVTGAMIDFLPVGDPAAIIARIAEPDIRIVSMTITEGGYFLDSATGAFDAHHPAIRADAADPVAPKTVFGLIIAGLARRRERGVPPFTVMSCDNIPGNGDVTRATVCGLAALFDPALAAWIGETVAFPNGMVDRIVPMTSKEQIAHLASEYGIDDAAPVFCEDFRQWVVEDHFPLGRPAFEKRGVQFVPDVAPYEHMKIRILNGGHAAIAYPGGLLDIEFVHEAMEHPLIGAFLEKLELEEIVPIVPPVPDTSLPDYFRIIEARFANPKIRDTIPRLAFDGSNRQPKFILPSTRDRLAQGKDVVGLTLVSALWCHYLAGTSDSGRAIDVKDPNAERIQEAARAARTDPKAFLTLQDVFGDLAQSERFVTRFTSALRSLQSIGTARTLEAYLDGSLAKA